LIVKQLSAIANNLLKLITLVLGLVHLASYGHISSIYLIFMESCLIALLLSPAILYNTNGIIDSPVPSGSRNNL